jgi:guanylate kinase
MIICIVGKTSSGKDSVARILKEKYGVNAVVSYSTAPKRVDQIEGVHHYFITSEEMARILKEEDVIAYSKTKRGTEYCATMKNLTEEPNLVYIIDPAGIKCLKEKGVDFKSIYIDCSNHEIVTRGSKRGDSLMKLTARLSEENDIFDSYKDSRDWDYIVDNNGSFEALVKQVDNICNKIL